MKTTKDNRHYTRTTAHETTWLDDLRVRHNFTSRSEAIRYCIQRTIEDESDAIGSRRHFSRTMNTRLDELSQQMAMYNETLFLAITELFSVLLVMLNNGQATEATDPEKMRVQLIQKIIPEMTKVMSMFKMLNQNRAKAEVTLKKARQAQRRKTSVTEKQA